MQYAKTNDIKKLVDGKENQTRISIFIPTHKIPLAENISSDRLRLKNAMQFLSRTLDDEAQKQLKSLAVKELEALYDDINFWRDRDNALAVYIDEDGMQYFDIPIEMESNVYVQENFVVSPLLAASQDMYTYYVLDINLDNPRLFHANQTAAKQILKDEMPKDISTALRIDENQQNLQHGTSRGGARDATHHGHGGRNDHKKNDIQKYMRLLASTVLENELHDKKSPLILAGEEGTVEMFKQVMKYKNILDTTIEGNQSESTDKQLHQKSWEIMLDYISDSQQMMQSQDRTHNKIVLDKIDDVVKAAKRGELVNLALGIIHKTHDSVVNRLEERYKIAMPTNFAMLEKIESSIRGVLQKGGEITSLIANKDDSRHMYGITYNTILA